MFDFSTIQIISPRNDIDAYRDKLTEEKFLILSKIINDRREREAKEMKVEHAN